MELQQPHWLKKTVLLPVALGLIASGVIVLVALLAVLSYGTKQEFARDYATMRAQWSHELAHHGMALRLIAEGLMRQGDMEHALATRDTKRLRTLAVPQFKHLETEHDIAALAVLDTTGEPLVAFQHPGIGSKTLQQALRSGLPQSGLEFDTWQNLFLVEVSPWYVDGELLGYVLLSAEFTQLLNDLSQVFDMQHLVVLPPEAGGEQALRIATKSMKSPPGALLDMLRSERLPELEAGVTLERADQWIFVGAMPITYADGTTHGWLLPLRDVSDVRAALLISAGVVLLVTALILALLLAFLHHVTRQAEQELAATGNELQQAMNQLENAHAEWVESFDAIEQPIFIHDEQYRVIRANRAYAKQAGLPFHDVLGHPYWEVFPRGDEPLPGCMKAMQNGGDRYEEELHLPDGKVYISRSFPIRHADGSYRFSIHVLQDITELERVTIALRHEMRARRTVTASQQALLHAASEEGLLQEVCRIACDEGGYPITWAAYKCDDAEKRLYPAGAAGISVEDLAKQRLSWSEEASKVALSARAIRTGTLQVVQDFANDARFTASTTWAREAGYAGALAIPIKYNSAVLGVLFIATSMPRAFSSAEITLLQHLADDLGTGITALRDRERQSQREQELASTLNRQNTLLGNTILALATAVEVRIPHTVGHQQRVMDLAMAIARQLRWEQQRVEAVGIAALVHDIGNLRVPTRLLAKEGKLDAAEFELVKTHPTVGYEILSAVDFPWPIAEMVLQHHERLDGSGYPSGLKGTAILPEAQIIGVAGVIEAMANQRPYRPALGITAALEELERCRGVKYDAAIVDACLHLFREQDYHFNHKSTELRAL